MDPLSCPVLKCSAMAEMEQKALARDSEVVESLLAEIEKAEPSRRSRILEKFFLAALSSIPWVGGVLSAAEAYRTEEGTSRLNHLQTEWLKEHQRKIILLGQTLQDIGSRLSSLGDEIEERIQSEEYLALVRKTFEFGTSPIHRKRCGCSRMLSLTPREPEPPRTT